MSTGRKFETRLPDDPGYWNGLAVRSIEAAYAGARQGRYAARPWWHAFAEASYALAVGAVLAVLGGSLLLDERPEQPPAERAALASALAPDDPLLVSLLDRRAEPPHAAALLGLIALRQGEP